MQHKAGMFFYALAFLLGVVFVQQCSVLPAFWFTSSTLLLFLLLYSIFNRRQFFLINNIQFTLALRFILLILFGIVFSSVCAKQQLSHRLNDALIGKNIIINGYVSGIPLNDDNVQRFDFTVTQLRVLATGGRKIDQVGKYQKRPGKIRLSWYYGRPVHAGEKWQLEVRLKPPHGFMNPGGFDYEAWLFQHGIHATGYVRKSNLNEHDIGSSEGLSITKLMASMNKIRQSLAQRLDGIADTALPGESEGSDQERSFSLIKALAMGDKSSISNQQWQVLRNTGTSHLMAISGLHVGLAAFFAYVLIRRLLPAFIMKRIPAQHVALSAGLLMALLYAMVSGLSISTQRAIIMLSVLAMMTLIRRNHRPLDALGFALILVLVFDPLAVLSAGFWFSFSAVAVIFITLSSADLSPRNLVITEKGRLHAAWARAYSILKKWIRLQLLITLFLLPLSLFMFQQVSLVSPVANLLLIPYVSFLVVPLVLAAMLCMFILPSIVAEELFRLAASLLDIIWPLLRSLAAQPYALWVTGDVDIVKLLVATAAMLVFYFSTELSSFIGTCQQLICRSPARQKQTVWSLRFIACLMFIPLFVTTSPILDVGEYRLTVLDVGQGSAAVIQTQNHVVVFDAGAKFSDKLNAGQNVVLPYLLSQGVQSLDYLIISHGDADHIGGAQALLDAFPEAEVIGQDIEKLVASKKQRCVQGKKWQWDGIDFIFLSPAAEDLTEGEAGKRNNKSCVLRVSSINGSVLFTGDIEQKAEKKLLKRYAGQLNSSILIAPHHGSKTSSSAALLAEVSPEISIFSVGYKNKYQFPNKQVMARYKAMDGEQWQTDKSGALMISISRKGERQVEAYREKTKKYWHHMAD